MLIFFEQYLDICILLLREQIRQEFSQQEKPCPAPSLTNIIPFRRLRRNGAGDDEPPFLEDEGTYHFNPPLILGNKLFSVVTCKWRVLGEPNKYAVEGVPNGGGTKVRFIQPFSPKGIGHTITRIP